MQKSPIVITHENFIPPQAKFWHFWPTAGELLTFLARRRRNFGVSSPPQPKFWRFWPAAGEILAFLARRRRNLGGGNPPNPPGLCTSALKLQFKKPNLFTSYFDSFSNFISVKYLAQFCKYENFAQTVKTVKTDKMLNCLLTVWLNCFNCLGLICLYLCSKPVKNHTIFHKYHKLCRSCHKAIIALSWAIYTTGA